MAKKFYHVRFRMVAIDTQQPPATSQRDSFRVGDMRVWVVPGSAQMVNEVVCANCADSAIKIAVQDNLIIDDIEEFDDGKRFVLYPSAHYDDEEYWRLCEMSVNEAAGLLPESRQMELRGERPLFNLKSV